MFVRPSKFRHVFGCPFKKEACYEGLKATKSAHDTNFCAANPLFLAVVVESSGGGSFVVLPIEKTGRVDVNTPKVCGHRAPITDIKWCPHNDHVIASSSDDCTIKVWSIPDEGLFHNITEPLVDLADVHYKRVSYIEWHPCAKDVLLSAGADHKCIVWDVREGSILKDISIHQDMIFSISWNFDGSLFVTTCKDKVIRVVDPRSGAVVAEGMGHQGNKASKAVFLNGTQIFSTGFSRSSERQYALWDYMNLSKPIKMEELDSSCGTIIPFFDPDLNIVYLAGKGDGNIRYVEVIDQSPFVYFLNQFQSSIPQRGLGMMPKRGLDKKKCEIARFYKLHSSKDICEPISMIVPRKSDSFQPDIYPPTSSTQPSLTADEWMSGDNKPPILVQLEDGSHFSAPYAIRRRTSIPVQPQQASENYQQDQNSTSPIKSPGRSKSLHRDINNIVRNNTFTTTTTQDECYNSVTDLASNNSLRKSAAVRRKRRTRTNHGLDDEPRSSPSSYDDDEHDTRRSDTIIKPKAIFPLIQPDISNNPSNQAYSTYQYIDDSPPLLEEYVAEATLPKEVDKDVDLVSTSDDFKVQNVLLLDSSVDTSEVTEDSEKHGSRAKLDCISVDAPDDGVILPSKLRASMTSRHRKVERSGAVSSSFGRKSDKPPNCELQGLIRVGSVREKSRNFNNIMDRNSFHRRSELQDTTKTNEPNSNDEININRNTSKDTEDDHPQQSKNPTSPKSNVQNSSTKTYERTCNIQQRSKTSVGKSYSDEAPKTNPPVKTATARILPMSNNSQARKFPGKSLSDFKTGDVQKSQSCKEQNGGRPAVERRNEKRSMEESMEEVVVSKHHNNNNNYINANENRRSSKSDNSMSHTELLNEFMKQQQEIKKLRSLLEQKDTKIKKLEEELQMYKYRNRRMI